MDIISVAVYYRGLPRMIGIELDYIILMTLNEKYGINLRYKILMTLNKKDGINLHHKFLMILKRRRRVFCFSFAYKLTTCIRQAWELSEFLQFSLKIFSGK